MIIDIDAQAFSRFFKDIANPFLSEGFIALNSQKADKIVRLVEDRDKPSIGLIAGIRNGSILSPFSAPFGGICYRKDTVYIQEIESFFEKLPSFFVQNSLESFSLILPPAIYSQTIDAKVINAMIRLGYQVEVPDITNWIDLRAFNCVFTQRNSREYYNQSLRNNLSFNKASDVASKKNAYDIVAENRRSFGRPIFMTFEDIENISSLWPVDYYLVNREDGKSVASAIFYRNHSDIVYALFWGDLQEGRPLRAMDFLLFNLFDTYKIMGYKYIDLGISTEAGTPNPGLLRFKESHEAVSSVRYKFKWINK